MEICVLQNAVFAKISRKMVADSCVILPISRFIMMSEKQSVIYIGESLSIEEMPVWFKSL